MNINEDYIYNLFETQPKKEIIITGEKRRSDRLQTEKVKSMDYSLSPMAHNILEYLTPTSKKRMIYDMQFDDINLEKKILLEEDKDPLYTYFENNEVGIFMELWLCSNLLCPGCKIGKLLKYLNPNMPVVDVMCSNDNHTIEYGPKYYQIKTTEKDASFGGYKYFSLKDKYIHTGSKKYGSLSHQIKLGDGINKKKILIGYICVEYVRNVQNNRFISIDLNTSFILIPKLELTPTSLIKSDLEYYKYFDSDIPIITFNESLFQIYTFKIYDNNDLFKNINIDLIFDMTVFKPERVKQKLFEHKYLKYKKKYLDLKNYTLLQTVSHTQHT